MTFGISRRRLDNHFYIMVTADGRGGCLVYVEYSTNWFNFL
ncbi:hypothetical protein DCCM_0060 [Desulfocucumis palustris]|uniref:Uncharacterized protein n=1 Tax=Desulfocucumis palustris TaxID=1898651 RepID=A0A2L2XCD3_9FIRM|nr:hypothetical protein DCCM_0060 [Desulfocucumis palustris]